MREALKKTQELLRQELVTLKERLLSFEALALQADLVIPTIICCDSRVVLPDTLVVIQTATGPKKVLCIPIPTIGSGAPSRSRLRGVLREIISWGVPKQNVRILVTQHGDTTELTGAADHITCGLRSFFEKNKKDLKTLRHRLIPWSKRYKAKHGDNTLAPDRLSLPLLRKEAPHIMELVDRLYQASGENAETRIPRRLLIRAAYRNSDFEIEGNELGVYERITEYLDASEYEDLQQTCAVGIALYDHQQKRLLLHNVDANLGFPDEIEFPGLIPRKDSHQDPDYAIISFGSKTIPFPVSTILPNLCGPQTPDNAFRTVASIPTVPTLLCAMAESSYAILHHNHPHDKNFVNLQKLLIICDNDKYVSVVKAMMKDPEFKEEYLPMLQEMQPKGIEVINLQLGTSKSPTLELISY